MKRFRLKNQMILNHNLHTHLFPFFSYVSYISEYIINIGTFIFLVSDFYTNEFIFNIVIKVDYFTLCPAWSRLGRGRER